MAYPNHGKVGRTLPSSNVKKMRANPSLQKTARKSISQTRGTRPSVSRQSAIKTKTVKTTGMSATTRNNLTSIRTRATAGEQARASIKMREHWKQAQIKNAAYKKKQNRPHKRAAKAIRRARRKAGANIADGVWNAGDKMERAGRKALRTKAGQKTKKHVVKKIKEYNEMPQWQKVHYQNKIKAKAGVAARGAVNAAAYIDHHQGIFHNNPFT